MSDYFLTPTLPGKVTTDEYFYNYNTRESNLNGTKDDWLKIVFINGKFDSVKFIKEDVFKWIGPREMKLADLINNEITKLEENYNKNKELKI